MKARQRKKWGWHECSHIKLIGPCIPLYIRCKQTGSECSEECCKKYTVSKFTKRCNHIGNKIAQRFVYPDNIEMAMKIDKGL